MVRRRPLSTEVHVSSQVVDEVEFWQVFFPTTSLFPCQYDSPLLYTRSINYGWQYIISTVDSVVKWHLKRWASYFFFTNTKLAKLGILMCQQQQTRAVQLYTDVYSNDILVNAIEAYRWSGGIALLILKLGLRWGWVVSSISGTRAYLDWVGTTSLSCRGQESNPAFAVVGLRKMTFFMIAEKQRGSKVLTAPIPCFAEVICFCRSLIWC